MVVLEVVHEVVGNGRLGSLLELDVAVNDLRLEVGEIDLVVVNDSGGAHCGNMKVENVKSVNEKWSGDRSKHGGFYTWRGVSMLHEKPVSDGPG